MNRKGIHIENSKITTEEKNRYLIKLLAEMIGSNEKLLFWIDLIIDLITIVRKMNIENKPIYDKVSQSLEVEINLDKKRLIDPWVGTNNELNFE